MHALAEPVFLSLPLVGPSGGGWRAEAGSGGVCFSKQDSRALPCANPHPSHRSLRSRCATLRASFARLDPTRGRDKDRPPSTKRELLQRPAQLVQLVWLAKNRKIGPRVLGSLAVAGCQQDRQRRTLLLDGASQAQAVHLA